MKHFSFVSDWNLGSREYAELLMDLSSKRTSRFIRRDFHFPITSVLLACLSLWCSRVNAATIYWDGANTGDTNNVSTGINLGGVGTWDNLTTSNWWDGLSASDVPWNNSNMDTAVFWGSAGTVTLGVPITAGAFQFKTTGYTLTGSTLALAGTGSVTAHLGTYTTISSQLNGTNGLTLAGTGSSGRGVVRLTNASNSYTGTTTISGGTLVITGDSQLGNVSNAVAINGVQRAGLSGGTLMLSGSTSAAGYATGLTLAATRNVTMTGGAVGYANSAPATSGSALINVGNATISGLLTTSPTPLGSAATGAVSGFGVLTLSNLSAGGTSVTNFTTFGSNGSIGGYHLNGTLSGTGSINKAGGGTLILAPTSASGFSGTVRVTAGSVRVTDSSALGTNLNTGLNSVFDLNGGVFEVRADTFDASTRGLASRASSTLFVDDAMGSSAINGTATFGNFIGNVGSVATFNSRNGFNTTFNASTITPTSTSAFTLGITNSGNGLVTFIGNVWGQASTSANTLTVTATGDIQFNTGITANAAITTNQFTKAGTGTLTITGVDSTFVSPTTVSAGTLAITDFRSLTLASTQNINLGATTVAGTLSIGTTTPSTAAGLTAAATRVINLAGTTGGATINANQTFAAPVILTAAFTASGVGSKTLTLGGTSQQLNAINGAIVNNSAANITSIVKADAGTWVLGGTNTNTGSTVITGGRLRLNTANSLADTTAVGFGGNAVTLGAGGTLELNAASGTEIVGPLNIVAGANTVSVSGAAGTLSFASIGAAQTAIIQTASTTVSVASTSGLVPGMVINGGSAAATIVSITNSTQFVASASQTYAVATPLTFTRPSGSTTGGIAAGTVNFTPGTGSVVIASVPAIGLLNGFSYFNGADFAYAPATSNATLRAPVYGTDAGFNNVALSGTLTLNSSNQLISDSGTSGVVTQAIAATINSLKLTANTTLTANALVTIQSAANGAGGILLNGGTALINGSAGITSGGTGDLVIRTNLAGDTLTLSAPITATTTGGLTKTGLGTLILTAANLQTGYTTVNEGTLQLSGSAVLSGSNAGLAVRQGAIFDINGVNTGPSIGQFNGAGTITNNGAAATITVGGGNGTGIFSGVIQNGTGVLNITKSGTGGQTWSGLNTYTGVTTIGSTGIVSVSTLANYGMNSGIGRGIQTAVNDANNAASLVFTGTTGGLAYIGNTSVSIDRLFTMSGTGATITNNSANNSTLIFNKANAITFGVTGPQTLTLGGSSTGDNLINLAITDSGTVANITSLNKTGAGLWILGGANTYTGITTISGTGATATTAGYLQAVNGSTLPTASGLILGGTTTGGVLVSSGNFTRNIVASASAANNTVSWATGLTTGASGFAASDSKLVVALELAASPGSPTALTWNSGGFMGTAGTTTAPLQLSSIYSLAEVEFRNAINLNGATRTIQVDDNVNTFTDFATITGVISNSTGAAGLTKTGTGILQLLEANTYNGPTSVQAGTLVVNSLGSSTGSGGSSVGAQGAGANTLAQAVILGNASTVGGSLVYVGPGETSDRYIQFPGTTNVGLSIVADGSGPLILTNVLNNTSASPTGAKNLLLRGVSTFANEITSNLNNDGGGGILSITRDSAGIWILSGNNGYTGGTSLTNGSFLGAGSDSAFGGFGGTPGALSITAGTVFASGADRTIRNPVTFSGTNSSIAAFVGEHSLTFTGNWSDGTTTSAGRFLRNNIISGKTLTLNGNYTYNTVTSSVSGGVTMDGSGDTIINGVISQLSGSTTQTSATALMGVIYAGTGSLTLGNTGNIYLGNTRISNGTLKLGADEVIPDGSTTAVATTAASSTASTTVTAPTANLYPGMTITGGSAPATITSITSATAFVASAAQTVSSGTNLNFSIARGNVVIDPAAAVTATFDLNGRTETINGLIATSAGNAVITNTAVGAASLTFGANNAAVTINSSGGGAATITGALSLTKMGTATATIASGQTLTYTGSTNVTSGTLTIASPLNGTSALSSSGVGSNLNITGLIAAPASINSVTVGGGAFLGFLDGVGTSISNLSTLDLGARSGTATLSLDLGTTSDTLTVLNPATITNTITFNLSNIVGFANNTPYNLLGAPGGLGTLSNYLLGIQPRGFRTGILSMTSDTQVIYTSGAEIVGNLFWNNTRATGSWATNSSSLTNFTDDSAGTIDSTGVPGPSSTVIFGTTNTTTLSGTTFTTTLDASFNVAGLQFTANPSGVTAWTINAGTLSTNNLTIQTAGMSVAANAGAVTISAPIVLGAAQTWIVNGSGANGSSLTLSGAITGGAGATLAITSSGVTGVVSMNAATGLNTYSGTTTVSDGGILQGGATNSFSTNSDFIVNGTGILRLNGFNNTIRSLSGTGGTVQNNNSSTIATLTVGASNASTSFSGALVNGGTATLGLTKVGTGTLTLGGTNSYTGITTVQGGSLQITGPTNNSPTGAGGATSIGNTASTFGRVEVPTGGSLTTDTISVGGTAGGVGSLVIRGGSVSTTDTAATTSGISVGTGGYGSLLLSSGSFSGNRVSLYNSATGTGVLQVSGGTLTSNEYIILSNLRTEFTVTGGRVLHNAASQNLAIAYNLSGTTVMNVAGGMVDNTGRSVSFGQLGSGTDISTGILNLGGGTLITNNVTVTAISNATINFNGGTLRAGSADSAAFIPSSARLTTYVNGAFGSFNGGAVIDTSGRSVTIASNLLSPVGSSGANGLNLGGVGSGYIGAPYVEIVRGAGDSTGTGATGYATIDTDPSSLAYGQVTSVVLTNPGMNYTSTPTVNLIGGLGAGGTAAVITASGIAANTSGGLTKNGTGTLTLTGANTYSGGTVVNAGTLTVGAGGTLGATTGTLAVNNPNTGAGTAVVLNLATAVDTTVASLSGTLASPSSGANTATINTQTNRNFTVNQTANGAYAGVIAGGGSLTLGSLSTNALALTGTNTYTGATTVSAGSLQVGSAGTGTTGTGAVTVQTTGSVLGTGVVRGSSFTAQSGSTVHAGDGKAQSNYGTLTFMPASGSGAFDFQSGSAIVLGINPGGTSDLLNFVGTGTNTLLFNGNLTVTATSFTPIAEETFNLLDWSGLSTAPSFDSRYIYTDRLFGNGDEAAGFDLPDISASGYFWDISNFITQGTISIVLVPEPSRAALMLIAVLAVFLRRSRCCSRI
jgi:autotransporter-associated beta strand protein